MAEREEVIELEPTELAAAALMGGPATEAARVRRRADHRALQQRLEGLGYAALPENILERENADAFMKRLVAKMIAYRDRSRIGEDASAMPGPTQRLPAIIRIRDQQEDVLERDGLPASNYLHALVRGSPGDRLHINIQYIYGRHNYRARPYIQIGLTWTDFGAGIGDWIDENDANNESGMSRAQIRAVIVQLVRESLAQVAGLAEDAKLFAVLDRTSLVFNPARQQAEMEVAAAEAEGPAGKRTKASAYRRLGYAEPESRAMEALRVFRNYYFKESEKAYANFDAVGDRLIAPAPAAAAAAPAGDGGGGGAGAAAAPPPGESGFLSAKDMKQSILNLLKRGADI